MIRAVVEVRCPRSNPTIRDDDRNPDALRLGPVVRGTSHVSSSRVVLANIITTLRGARCPSACQL